MKKEFLLIVLLIVIVAGFLGLYFFVQKSSIFPAEENGQEESEENFTVVKLYYYNPEKDKDEQGNIKCSVDGLVAIEKEIVGENIIEETINLLIKADITEQEKEEKGIETEFPLDGFELIGVDLKDGVLTLSFDDPQSQTIGGSCRTGILWHQISQTAKQFEGVGQVRFEPQDMLFQP